MGLEKVKGTIEREKSIGVGIPEKVTIILTKTDDIDKVYDMIKNDENFILEDGGKKAKLIVANPLSAKLENGELEIISEL